jgi:hypothetical protein
MWQDENAYCNSDTCLFRLERLVGVVRFRVGECDKNEGEVNEYEDVEKSIFWKSILWHWDKSCRSGYIGE